MRRVIFLVALVSGCGGGMRGVRSGTEGDSEAPVTKEAAAPSESPSRESTSRPVSPPTQITARHVLIQWMGCRNAPSSVVRTREQAEVVASDVLKRARAGENFARLAVEFSDEPNAGRRGGSLGRFGKGQMDRQFEEAAFALAPGALSSVVESPFGFHVIQRIE
jgi:hypothetical protein